MDQLHICLLRTDTRCGQTFVESTATLNLQCAYVHKCFATLIAKPLEMFVPWFETFLMSELFTNAWPSISLPRINFMHFKPSFLLPSSHLV